jgi:hypothetical protein
MERPRSLSLRAALRWADTATRPSAPTDVHTADGSRLSGVLLVDDNQVIRVLAVRRGRATNQRLDNSARSSHPHSPHDYADESEPWDEYDVPWRR